jgi:hypothetical protein
MLKEQGGSKGHEAADGNAATSNTTQQQQAEGANKEDRRNN